MKLKTLLKIWGLGAVATMALEVAMVLAETDDPAEAEVELTKHAFEMAIVGMCWPLILNAVALDEIDSWLQRRDT